MYFSFTFTVWCLSNRCKRVQLPVWFSFFCILNVLYLLCCCCCKLQLFRTSADRKIHVYVAVIGDHAADCCVRGIIESSQPAALLQFAFLFQQPPLFVFQFIFVIFASCPLRNVYCVWRLGSRFTFWRAATVVNSALYISLLYVAPNVFSVPFFFSHSFPSVSRSSDLTILPTADLFFSIWTDFW
jgi:hypothetical protein